MHFQKDQLYHVFNQGNNRRKIFFQRENYLFFLQKVKNYITPYADIVAWCLMPNHFHILFKVNFSDLNEGFTQSETLNRSRSLNDSIGIMLRSYTRAINKQENISGSLFRKETKSSCLTCQDSFSPAFFTKNGISSLMASSSEKDYPKACFNYIHENPVKAGLVKSKENWEFSSAKDYSGLRNGKLVNKNVALEYFNFE